MIKLEPCPGGVNFLLQAHAGAKKNEISGVQDGILKVSVSQAPEKGKANKAIIAVLSEFLSLRKSQFAIISGETSRRKKVFVQDVSPQEFLRRIESVLGK